jgi:hypothetical protein
MFAQVPIIGTTRTPNTSTNYRRATLNCYRRGLSSANGINTPDTGRGGQWTGPRHLYLVSINAPYWITLLFSQAVYWWRKRNGILWAFQRSLCLRPLISSAPSRT